MEHPIIALSFQHKRFSRLDVLTALGDRAGESQRLLLPRVEELSGKIRPPGKRACRQVLFCSRI